MQIRRYKTELWIAIGLLSFVAVCVLSPARHLFDYHFLLRHLNQLGMWSALVFVLGFATATSLGFPGNVMTIVGGAVFGLAWGTIWSLIGATAGAAGAFWLARYLLHDWAERRFGHHPTLNRLKQMISHQPFHFVLSVRLNPISPFSLVNFLFGLTPVGLKTYTVSTCLGIAPGTFAYAWLGASGKQAWQGGDQLPLVLALSLLAGLSLLPLLKRRNAKPAAVKAKI